MAGILENAIRIYAKEMVEKFHLKSADYGARDVTIVANRLLTEPGVLEGLLAHLADEIQEFKDGVDFDDRRREAVDIGNLAFLLWWRSIREDWEYISRIRMDDSR